VVQSFSVAVEKRKRKWSEATILKMKLKETEDDKALGKKIAAHVDFLGSKSNPIVVA
jgi:hypothetical protein